LSSDISRTRHSQSLFIAVFISIKVLRVSTDVFNADSRSKIGETDYISLILDVCEKVQKFALRVCSKQGNTSEMSYYQLFSLPTLQQCRLYLDLSTTFKIVNSLSYFPSGMFVEHTPRTTRPQFYQSYVCPYAHTNEYCNSFIPHTIIL